MTHERTKVILRGAGVAPRELRALDVAPIHPQVKNPEGFGFIGKTGLGKTWAMVQEFGRIVDAKVVESADPDGYCAPFQFSLWANWPDQAESLKRLVANSDGEDLGNWIERAHKCRFLFLDDLGQERIKGTDDYSLGLLKEIIDQRHRNNLPLFWTSNLTLAGLSHPSMYGSRIASRMCEAWPPITLKGDDLRLGGRTA